MANIFDLLSLRRSAPGPWDKPRFRPQPNWHRRPERKRGAARTIALFLGFFAFGGFLAFAATNYGGASIEAMLAPERRVETPEPYRPTPPPVHFTADDGDSLRQGNERIRLLGIDAPELSQSCRDAQGRPWPCGRAAHERLAAILARGPVRCTPQGQDRYGRTLARCSAGPVADIGEAMVREGLALDYMQGGYKAAESKARAAKRGIWAGEFDLPQEHRRRIPRRTQSN